MFPMVLQLIEILAPVFICVGLGVGWVRMGESFDTLMVTKLVTYIGTPALVFYALATADLEYAVFAQMGLAAVLANGLFLFAQLYNQRPTEVAGVVIVSTLMSTISLPLLLAHVL